MMIFLEVIIPKWPKDNISVKNFIQPCLLSPWRFKKIPDNWTVDFTSDSEQQWPRLWLFLTR